MARDPRMKGEHKEIGDEKIEPAIDEYITRFLPVLIR